MLANQVTVWVEIKVRTWKEDSRLWREIPREDSVVASESRHSLVSNENVLPAIF